ncbi:hypothetical protein CNECB9_3950005 [Cupriavidus necator]|uniref:Uncharacterized protein n=1 Tax=Cupriavidus necator TaxID=106590 RepID=A0A1K0JRG6_CUPNE|nr:hypothetical protein CNECB9_3950005 [Cupriavidus necator]
MRHRAAGLEWWWCVSWAGGREENIDSSNGAVQGPLCREIMCARDGAYGCESAGCRFLPLPRHVQAPIMGGKPGSTGGRLVKCITTHSGDKAHVTHQPTLAFARHQFSTGVFLACLPFQHSRTGRFTASFYKFIEFFNFTHKPVSSILDRSRRSERHRSASRRPRDDQRHRSVKTVL